MLSTAEQTVRRLSRSMCQEGLAGTLRKAGRQFVYEIRNWRDRTPGEFLARWRRTRAERDYDRRHNVDTAGRIEAGALIADSANRRFAKPYSATRPEFFAQMMARLPIDHARFTFVDFGCGKGKAMLLASEYPFRRIVGVEFSPELHVIACENVLSYRSPTQKCRDIQPYCGDATEFVLPSGPLVCYVYNPFVGDVMEQVLRNIRTARDRERREIYLVYHAPLEGERVARHGFVRIAAQGDDFAIYSMR